MNVESSLVIGTELPFRRSVGEPERAFACFRVYLELGEERMWADVAEKTGISFYTIKCWAWRYKWEKRIATYYEWAEEQPEQGGAGETVTEEPPAQPGNPAPKPERLVGERLRRAAERALERFACGPQARKVGLGEIARTFATALRLERPEGDKSSTKEKPWLTPEEDAAIEREFLAAVDTIVAAEERKEQEKIAAERQAAAQKVVVTLPVPSASKPQPEEERPWWLRKSG